jgi:hypothetical protein
LNSIEIEDRAEEPETRFGLAGQQGIEFNAVEEDAFAEGAFLDIDIAFNCFPKKRPAA